MIWIALYVLMLFPNAEYPFFAGFEAAHEYGMAAAISESRDAVGSVSGTEARDVAPGNQQGLSDFPGEVGQRP